jgi:hypothetical protein
MTIAEQRLLNPPPGGAIERARNYGIDLTLLIERLRLTPDERLRDQQRFTAFVEKIREAGRQARDRS